MACSEGVIWCDKCGVEITWSPVVKFGAGASDKRDFCCEDCYIGNPCHCGERMEMEDERRETSGMSAGYSS